MKYLTPLSIFVTYWIFTLLLYAFGPFAWVTYKPWLFWSLNVFYIVAFIIGWLVGKKVTIGKSTMWNSQNDKELVDHLGIMIYINLFYEIINTFRTFLFSKLDFAGLLKRLVYGINNMGESYNSFQDNVNINSSGIVGGRIMTVFNYCWDFFALSTLLLSIVYFAKLKTRHKVVACFTLFLICVTYLARGTNIGVFRIVLAIIVFFYIRLYRNKGDKKQCLKLLAISFIGIVVVLFVFDRIMKSRGGITAWQMDNYNIGGIHLNRNSAFFKMLPSSYHQLLVSLTGYLAQGYYGMSLALNVPWIPMFGMGFSMAIQKIVSHFIPNIVANSYQSRIEIFGWENNTRWHSMYTWFANDISFPGVIILMFLFGFIFYKAYEDCRNLNNPYAKLMLFYLFLMAVFLPCNNQLAQTTYVMFSCIFVFFKWQTSKHNIRIHLASSHKGD